MGHLGVTKSFMLPHCMDTVYLNNTDIPVIKVGLNTHWLFHQMLYTDPNFVEFILTKHNMFR